MKKILIARVILVALLIIAYVVLTGLEIGGTTTAMVCTIAIIAVLFVPVPGQKAAAKKQQQKQ